MRVLILVENLPVPFDRRVWQEACALRDAGHHVMMIGDGLNDAIAMRESNIGIALAEDCNTFTPASDGIMESANLGKLHRFIRLCRANKQIILASFAMSIVYNI